MFPWHNLRFFRTELLNNMIPNLPSVNTLTAQIEPSDNICMFLVFKEKLEVQIPLLKLFTLAAGSMIAGNIGA